MEKHSKINLISAIILVGFALAVFFHYFMGAYLHFSFPYNTFLFTPNAKFTDFFDSIQTVKNLTPYVEPSSYFPFSYVLLYGVFLISKIKTIQFIIVMLPFILFLTYFNYKYLKTENSEKISLFKNVFIFSFLSYPFIFVIDRGNIESFVFIFIAMFFYFYLKKDYMKSIIFLSFAAAMKMYPAIFLLLLLKDKKYREIVYAVGLTFALTLTSLLIFNGGLYANVYGLFRGLYGYSRSYILGDGLGMAYNSSLFGIVKLCIVSLGDIIPHYHFVIKVFATIFNFLSLILSGLMTLYILFVEKTLWKQVAILTIIMILLMPVSYDYKLISLFIPLWLFINSENKSKHDIVYAICFGLLLIPKQYFFIPKQYLFIITSDISISVFLNPLIMIIMLILIIDEGLKKHKRVSPALEENEKHCMISS